jgi:NitT/TauT family transport system substrate-binding protein
MRCFTWRALAVGAVAVLLAACGGAGADEGAGTQGGEGSSTLRLGYFPNVTHAPAIAGIQ